MEQPENKPENLLTSIHGKYTLSNTSEGYKVIIQTFLETLAEVSLSIATRKLKQVDKGIDK
jgi:hypothetical protein